IEVNGLPGWDTTNAMLIAYQIEDGISVSTINNETSSGIYDFTKQGFVEISSETDFSIKSNQNKLMILQGAFYVKGINPGGFAPTYSSEFTTAVETLQSNAGVEVTGIADFLVVKALLSMDAFTVLPQYGGIETIATIQRTLNAEYANDMGSLIPCDGVYGRNLNKALIYALQIQEGFSVAEANEADGYFSPGTQSKCPTLSLGDANIFVTLLKYALYCNGYTDIDISNDVFDQATQTAIYEVQSFLGLNRTGEAGVDTWMALLLSSGNPNMSVTGCDVWVA
ncbi:peptidoglycan-binding domain-containing protein, partial [Sarcina ventriculi]|uniref:peptidoglycan-binding domain-containing protein n=1 Tax=Sarcina ventriculi TaxID=1267 RepID=UPI001C11E560